MAKMITEEQQKSIDDLITKLKLSADETVEIMDKYYKVQEFSKLTEKQAENFIVGLTNKLEKKNQETSSVPAIQSETQVATPVNEMPKIWEKEITELLNLNTGALVADFNKKRFVSNALNLMFDPSANKIDWSKLKKEEVFNCLLNGAKYDLEYGREFHIIPRWNKYLKRQCATAMFDYKGYIKIMKNHSIEPIKNIVVNVVYKGDIFEVDMFAEPPIKHKMLFQSEGKENVTHAYCCIIYANGSYDPEILTRKQLDDIEATSKDETKTFWGTWYTEMAKKSAIRRIQKRVPLNFPDAESQKVWREEIASDSDFNNQVKEEHKVIDISGGMQNV